MSDISWSDGLAIIQAAREALNGAKPVETQPPAEHKSILSDEQAQAFQLMMNILGHNGDTVGRGQTVDLGKEK